MERQNNQNNSSNNLESKKTKELFYFISRLQLWELKAGEFPGRIDTQINGT